MKCITVWHRQLSYQCFSFLQVVFAGGCVCRTLYESSPPSACGHQGWKRRHPDKCVQKITLRHLFLNSLTLAAERGKKAHCGTHCWQPLRGGVHETNTCAHTNKKGIPVTPLLALLWWCKEDIAAWGGPIRDRDRREKGDDSLVQSDNFLPLFLLFMLITCEDVCVLHASIYKFFCVYVCVHPIIFNASVIDDQKVTFKGKNEDGIHFWIHTCKYIHEEFILEQTQSCTIRPAPMPPRKWIQLSVQLTNKDTK